MKALSYIDPTAVRDRKTSQPRSVELIDTVMLSPEEADTRTRTLARLIIEAAIHRQRRLRAARLRDTLTSRKSTKRLR